MANDKEPEKPQEKVSHIPLYTFADIDNTMTHGNRYLLEDVVNYFASTRLKGGQKFANLFHKAEEDNRREIMTYSEFAETISRGIEEFVKGKKVEDFRGEMHEYAAKPGSLISPRSREIQEWTGKEKGSKIIALTANPSIVVDALGMEFHDRIATELETDKAGKYFTGKIVPGKNLFKLLERARAFKRYVREHGIDPMSCAALGDSGHDRYILRNVGKPVARNPSKRLEEAAVKENYLIVRDEDPSIEVFKAYMENSIEHWKYWCGLDDADRHLVEDRDHYFDGSWDSYLEDVDAAIKGKRGPVMGLFKGGNDENVRNLKERIKKMKEYEEKHKFDLGIYRANGR